MFDHKFLIISHLVLYILVNIAPASSTLFILAGHNYLDLSLAQVIELNGFEARTYKVVGFDGYITTATRVINPKANLSDTIGTVIVHHGIMQSLISPQLSLCGSTRPQTPTSGPNGTIRYSYLDNQIRVKRNPIPFLNSAIEQQYNMNYNNIDFNESSRINHKHTDTCLIYYLSNSNYDVWLLEARGSTPQSSGHVNKSIDSKEYWNFDVSDQAKNDLPAQIAKVQEISGNEKVAYIGFSISTAYMFMLLSERPEIKENLTAVILVAPISYLSEASGLTRLASFLPLLVGTMTDHLNMPFPADSKGVKFLDELMSVLCNIKVLATTVCRFAINMVIGPDNFQNVLNKPLLSRIVAPTSFKSLIQAGQWIYRSNTFNKFDYKDPEMNNKRYNQSTAPQYNLSNIYHDHMIFIRSPNNDYLSAGHNQRQMISNLQMPLYKDIVVDDYNHLGYWLASSSFEKVIKPIRNALDEIYDNIDR